MFPRQSLASFHLVSIVSCVAGYANIAWGKLHLLRELILNDTSVDYFLWIDTDAVILNLDTKLRDFIVSDKELFITEDMNGFNTGIFFLKNSPWSLKFLSEILALQPTFHGHEQDAMARVLVRNRQFYYPHIEYLPQCALNSYPNYFGWWNAYQRGDFIAHVPGQRHKLDTLTRTLAHANGRT